MRPSLKHAARLSLVAVIVAAGAHACTDSPERFADAVRRDVDGTSIAMFRLSARLNLTIVGGKIPVDSLAVWAMGLASVADLAEANATHFRKLDPSPGMESSHAQLSAALDDLSSVLRRASAAYGKCARSTDTSSATGSCTDQLWQESSSIGQQIAAAADGLRLGRRQAARALAVQGVTLAPLDYDMAAR